MTPREKAKKIVDCILEDKAVEGVAAVGLTLVNFLWWQDAGTGLATALDYYRVIGDCINQEPRADFPHND